MITDGKIIEIFYMSYVFCKLYDRYIKAKGLAPERDKSKRKYHVRSLIGFLKSLKSLRFLKTLKTNFSCRIEKNYIFSHNISCTLENSV